jgi:hypothetical protein
MVDWSVKTSPLRDCQPAAVNPLSPTAMEFVKASACRYTSPRPANVSVERESDIGSVAVSPSCPAVAVSVDVLERTLIFLNPALKKRVLLKVSVERAIFPKLENERVGVRTPFVKAVIVDCPGTPIPWKAFAYMYVVLSPEPPSVKPIPGPALSVKIFEFADALYTFEVSIVY